MKPKIKRIRVLFPEIGLEHGAIVTPGMSRGFLFE
jgi:hypothetical protein